MAATKEDALKLKMQVEQLFCTLNALVRPPDQESSINSIVESINNNLTKAVDVTGKENTDRWIQLLNDFNITIADDDEPCWRFVALCLASLWHLKEIIQQADEVVLLSASQRATFRAALQFVCALGIATNLKPGVGTPIESRCHLAIQFTSSPFTQLNISDLESYDRLSGIVRVLLKLYENKTQELYQVTVSTTLGDLIPALVQLAWIPISPELSTHQKTYLQLKKKEFQSLTSNIIQSLHQPTIIRELLVVQSGSPKKLHPSPTWLIRACTRFLTNCLLAPRGAISAVRALHDLGDSNGERSKQYCTTAKLLSAPHGPKPDDYYQQLCPQLLELLKCNNTEYQNVSASTTREILYKRKELCVKEILQPLWKPLTADFGELNGNLVLEVEFEEELFSTVNALLALTSLAGIHTEDVEECMPHLCNFFLAIRHKGATPRLRAVTLELLARFITDVSSDNTWNCILNLPEDCLLHFANTNCKAANAIFLHLLVALQKSSNLEEKLSHSKLLVSVTEISSVQKESLQNPNATLIAILKLFLNKETDSELIPVALLLLGTMVSECNDWKPFQCLVPELQSLRESITLPEGLRAIAEEILATVATFGLGNPELHSEDTPMSTKQSKKNNEQMQEVPKFAPSCKNNSGSTADLKLPLEQALLEIKDPEIPVRGHGYIALKKLIIQRDSKALSSKNKLFDICLEGLKHEDTYVYLAAVGALSALTLESLEELLPRVTQGYCTPELGVTLRTRLGESLLQVCKGIGEIAGWHQTTLLHAFLSGAKDSSPAIRASSLSNLGETCKVLGFKVSSQLQEILNCAQALASTDPEFEVRRAAALLMSLLLQGLGSEVVTTLGPSTLDLYRNMKQLSLSDDPVLCLQAQLALDELSNGIKENLFKPQVLEKKIFITSTPS